MSRTETPEAREALYGSSPHPTFVAPPIGLVMDAKKDGDALEQIEKLIDDHVRRIVREELARAFAKLAGE